ncbi:MAG: hypothetical protein QW267_03615, partial [Sulfolobales archaeon]
LSRMLRALDVIKFSNVYKLMSNKCFGDPGFPRPTADRGEGVQGSRDDPPQENLQNLRWEMVEVLKPI